MSKRKAIITGASNGIGKAIALKLAELGIDVLINYYSDEDSANNVVKRAEEKGVDAYAVKADVGTTNGIKKIFDAALDHFGHIDILVNNAGVFIDSDFLSANEEDFHRTMNVIAKGSYFLTQRVVKSMIEKKIKGRIINISSAATQDFTGTSIDYCMAKAGINIMTRAVAKAVGKYGITCNCIIPGTIPTKINKWQFDDPKIRESLKRRSVLYEFGDTQYIAKAVEYFVSDNAKWTTGAQLNVDGGYSL